MMRDDDVLGGVLEGVPAGLRVPRAYADEVRTAHEALAVCALAVRRPREAETIVLCLDARRRGVGMRAYVPGRDLGTLADRIVGDVVRTPGATGCIVCSVRPRRAAAGGEAGGPAGVGAGSRAAADWRAARRLADRAGVVMVAWYVAGPGGVAEVR